jgi:hypothetical protein
MYELTIVIDLVVVTACIGLLLSFGRLSHSHPATIYLIFHLYTFTSRIIAIAFGAPTLYSTYGPSFRAVEPDEIIHAMILADVALSVVTYACIKASSDDLKNLSKTPQMLKEKLPNLSFQHITRVARITFPVGLVALFAFTYIPNAENLNVNLGELENSSSVAATRSWAGVSLLAMIYWSGFRWYLMSIMSVYLGILALQGMHRFRVILPTIMLVQIYLDRNKMRWPSLRICAMLLCMGMIFFPLKRIGSQVRQGASFDAILTNATEEISEAASGEAGDQMFLDMFACGLTLTDEGGRFYYGATYWSLVTLPIPRAIWADKPGLADHVINMSTPDRPMGEMGMIITYLGEAYINFWYLGIVLTPFLAAYLATRFYFWGYRNHYFSVQRFAYMLLAVNMIQILRDGLISIFTFIFLSMGPLVAILVLHYYLPVKWRLRTQGSVPGKLQPQAPVRALGT